MNPFLHHPIAASMLPVHTNLTGPAWHASARSTRQFLRRSIGRLVFAAGLALISSPSYALDVNIATAAELETIRGLGPRTAETIIKERDRGGKFESLSDLTERVRGIGQKKAQALQAAGLSVGDPALTAAGATGVGGQIHPRPVAPGTRARP